MTLGTQLGIRHWPFRMLTSLQGHHLLAEVRRALEIEYVGVGPGVQKPWCDWWLQVHPAVIHLGLPMACMRHRNSRYRSQTGCTGGNGAYWRWCRSDRTLGRVEWVKTNQYRYSVNGVMRVSETSLVTGLWVIQEPVGRKLKAKILALVSTELFKVM